MTTAFELEVGQRSPLRLRRTPKLTGVALLAGLAVALIPGVPSIAALGLVACGVCGVLVLIVPAALHALARHRGLVIVVPIVALAVAWVVGGLNAALALPGYGYFGNQYVTPQAVPVFAQAAGWPWRVDGVPALLPLLAILCAAGGLVLLADAVRVQLGLERPPRTQWRLISGPLPRTGRIASRAVPGVALVVVAATIAMSLASGPWAYAHPLPATLMQIGIGAWSAALIASPLAVGAAMQLDLDKTGRARERERQRFAAHLHDSVLQTLALVQRQAHDPAAVTRLARRQEHALRAWMAGESELAGDTVMAALRDVAAELEDEHEMTIELTAIGDHALDLRSEELVAAAREALRNAACHASGAPVFVFGDITSARAEVFIRDEGPGFDPEAVPAERRGLRDAIIGRLAAAGGSATVESTAGQGTEVVLRLPYSGKAR